MPTNLARFESEDGIELVIDLVTGESFATQSGYARMVGKDKSTISRRYGTVAESKQKTDEIITTTGLKTVSLIDEDLIAEWLPKDSPELATKLLKLSTRIFLHELAGYNVTVSSDAIVANIQPTEDEIETFEANRKEIANLQRAISRMELKSQFNVTFSYVHVWKFRNSEKLESTQYNYDIYEACIVNEIYTKVFGGTKSELCKKMNLPVDKSTNIRDHIPLHALEALRMFEKYFKQLIVVMEVEPHNAIELALKSIQADADWCGVSFPIEFNRAKAITCPSTFSEEDWLNHWKHELGERKEAVKLFLIKYDGYEPKAIEGE